MTDDRFSDDTMDQVIAVVQDFLETLKTLGIDQVYLKHNYGSFGGTTKSRKEFSGRVVRSFKQRHLDLVVATAKAKPTEPEGK